MIQHLGKIEHIDIYFDPDHDKSQILLGRKGNQGDTGYVWVANKDMEMCEGVTMEKSEVEKILKENAKNTKFIDYNFAVGSFSTLDPYQKLINKIKKWKS